MLDCVPAALQVEVIRLLVASYFDIVRSNLADLVPKCLMRFMVHHSQKGMQQHLIATLYRDNLASELLTEREDVAKARSKCVAAVAALQAASETLEDVPAELTNTIMNTVQAQSAGDASSSGSGSMFLPAPERHQLGPADRHPSMHIAAQIATATSLMVAGTAATAAAVAAEGAAVGVLNGVAQGVTPFKAAIIKEEDN